MKNKSLFILTLAAAIFSACQPNAPAEKTEVVQSSAGELKGQAGVIDDASAKNILQVALGSKDHTTLVAAVQATQMENILVNAGPLTVFAPTNEAFAQLPAGVLDDLLKPENKQQLARIIKYHASPGKYIGDLFKDGQQLYQASGHYVTVKKDGDRISVGGANIIGTVEASNGVIHVVDKVMLPPN